MRKKIAMLLAACVVAGMAAYPSGIGAVQAAEVQEMENAQNIEGDFEYEELANGTVKITKYKGSGTEAVIPSAINGKTVAIIESLASVECSNLQRIKIPSGVTTIGKAGYSYPELSVFEECSSLTEIIVDGENAWYSSKEGILYNKEKTKLLVCPAAKEGEVAVENGITDVDTSVFQGCNRLTSIMFPSSVTSIDQYRYGWYMDGCSSLEEIIVDADNGLYYSQDGILYKKETDVFGNEKGMLLMRCPAGKKGSVAIPEGVTGIGERAFRDCSSLREIIIPDGTSSIGLSAFQNCSSLTGIMIPKSVSQIDIWDEEYEYNVFQNCSSLTGITVDMENEAYASSDGMLFTKDLTKLICCPAGKKGEIAVPDGVTSIAGTAFDDCNSLTKITIPKSVSWLAEPNDNDWRSMTFGRCSSLEEIIVDSYNRIYSSLDGILYSKDMSQLKCCPPGKKGEVEIPDGVQRIRAFSFYNCGFLTSILIPNSVSKIEEIDYDEIESNAFLGCSNLTEIKVNDGNESYFSLDGILYRSYRESIYLLCCPVGKEGDIKIPENVSDIGSEAFANCINLGDIIIPESVWEIGNEAFRDCINLGNVTILGQGGRIGRNVFQGCGNALCIICLEGSKAETYAIENGINYKAIKKEQQFISALDFTKTLGDMPFPINAVLDGEGELYYTSSDESVVSVSSAGIVTVNGVGTAEIIIEAEETGSYAAAQKVITITVNPRQEENQKPGTTDNPGGSQTTEPGNSTAEKKAQTITASDINKIYGAKPFRLNAKADGGALSYKAKNKKVATVDASGKVTIKGCGRTEIVITAAAHGEYKEAEKTIKLTVEPKKLSVTSAKSTKAKIITVKWKKDKKASGYIIECSTDKNFKKNVKTVTASKSKSSAKLTKLKAGKKYYVRACAYASSDGGKVKGAYSKVKKAVKVK